MEWTFHHLVGTAGHPGEVDKPNDFAFRRVAPAPDQLRYMWAPSGILMTSDLSCHLLFCVLKA